MRIAGIDTFMLSARGEQGAYGAPYGVVVRVTTSDGLVGYGESDSMPAVVRAVIEAPFLHEMMSGLKWVLLGRDPFDTEGLWTRMAEATLNYSRDGATLEAMAAIDLALWDLKGKALGKPVSELLGELGETPFDAMRRTRSARTSTTPHGSPPGCAMLDFPRSNSGGIPSVRIRSRTRQSSARCAARLDLISIFSSMPGSPGTSRRHWSGSSG